MNIQTVNVTITLKMALCDLPEGITFEQIAEAMTRDSWSDGRYPFHLEMLQEGLRQEVHSAIQGVAMTQAYNKHGNERVEHANGWKSLAPIKAEEAMKGVSIVSVESIKAASIEPARES